MQPDSPASSAQIPTASTGGTKEISEIAGEAVKGLAAAAPLSQAEPAPGFAADAGDLFLTLKNELMGIAYRPGWKTSELWLLLAIAGVTEWFAYSGRVDATGAQILLAIVGLVFTKFRQDHKSDIFGQVAALEQQVAPGIKTQADVEDAVLKVLPLLSSSSINHQPSTINPLP